MKGLGSRGEEDPRSASTMILLIFAGCAAGAQSGTKSDSSGAGSI
jgi:hypothetical protein